MNIVILLQEEPMTLAQIWCSFQNLYLPQMSSSPTLHVPTQSTRFDNPFLINYVVYHHYRSLGWVVKGGIKFCVDYLLYKRGPVFHHAESVLSFAVCQYPELRPATPQICNSSMPCLRRSCRSGGFTLRAAERSTLLLVMA